jgi:hypothetical protein
MTYIPTSSGSGNVTATIDNTVANFGAVNFPASPNFATGDSSTETFEITALNVLNTGTVVP